MRFMLSVMVCIGLAYALTSCTADQANQAQTVTNEVKTGIAIGDAALNAVNALITAADANSKVATKINTVTTIANKVNGVAQSINIVIPVEPVTPVPATVPAAASK